MPNKVILDRLSEFCDGSGRTLGYFLPAEEYDRRLQAERDRAQELQARCEHLERSVREIEEDRDRLQRSVAQLRAERDEYLKSLYAWARNQVSQEELERCARQSNGRSPAEVLAEAARSLAEKKGA
jgi:uncharacterized coiled-coil DUF342 family protein